MRTDSEIEIRQIFPSQDFGGALMPNCAGKDSGWLYALDHLLEAA
jgi:hypothetical protein